MNSCVLMAEIIKDPELRYTSDNQTAIAEMLVQFPGLKAEEDPTTLKVVGWGNLAQEIQGRFKKGDRVVIEGRLGMNTIDRPEGFKEKRAELTISRIHPLGADVDFGAPIEATPAAGNVVPIASRSIGGKRTVEPKTDKSSSWDSAESEPVTTPSRTYSAPAPEPDLDDIPF